MRTLFFRLFAFCGLTFGLIQGGIAAIEGQSPRNALLVGLGAALFFGLLMAASLTTLSWWRMKRSGIDPHTAKAGVDVRERITVPLTPDQAFALCRSAVQQVPKATVVQVDAASATLKARVGMTWASFGERIECQVTPAEGAAEVSIRSRPVLRTTIADYGKNRENVERIRTFLARRASITPVPQP